MSRERRPLMHAHSPHSTAPGQPSGPPWWYGPVLARLAILAAFGLALATPHPAQAKTFHCGAGDVPCLIAAIRTANANGQGNTIRLEAGTYILTAVDNDTDGANGLPVITSTLTITGAGATTTSIERNASAPAFRLLRVAATGVVTLQGLTLSGGAFPPRAPGIISGGGIFNSGTLRLTQSTITANGAGQAGGIFNSGTLTVTQSTITDNRGFSVGYGGIFNSGTLTVTQSTITDNGGNGAGGIANDGGTVTITTTTFAYNSADGGGAIQNRGTLTVTDSSFTDNIAYFTGAGTIENFGTLAVTNTTFARNLVVSDVSGAGAAIANYARLILTNSTLADNQVIGTHAEGSALASASGATTILQNTLLARNVGRSGLTSRRGPDCVGGVTSLGNNLIGDPTGCTITMQGTDLTGNPGLDTFTDNGTPGNGHFPLLPTSQAIDAGNDAVCPKRDQLGEKRVGPCDIGAIRFLDQDDR